MSGTPTMEETLTPAASASRKAVLWIVAVFVLGAALGVANVIDSEPVMASEDFGLLGLADHKIPTVMFWLGAMDPAKLAVAKQEGVVEPMGMICAGSGVAQWLVVVGVG